MYNCEECKYYKKYRNCPFANGRGERWDIKSLEKSAKKSEYEESRLYVAVCLLNGYRTEQNIHKAIRYLKALCKDHYSPARYFLSLCYFNGTGVHKDIEQAIELCSRAANSECRLAQIKLYQCYRDGIIVEKNLLQAFHYCLMAVSNYGDGEITRELAELCLKNTNDYRATESDYYKYLAEAAHKGDEIADKRLCEAYKQQKHPCFARKPRETEEEYQLRLGEMYANNKYIADGNKAIECLSIAVKTCWQKANEQLGLLYYNGKQLPQDLMKAYLHLHNLHTQQAKDAYYTIYRKYANHLDEENEYFSAPEGKYLLAEYYYKGYYTEKDLQKAFDLYSEAAKSNIPEAIRMLGVFYYNGYIAEKNYEKAIECFSTAIDLNFPPAKTNLALCYLNGYGVEKNSDKAFTLLREAAFIDDSEALNLMGYCYENGIGTPANQTKAAEWYKRAARQGHADAQNSLGDCNFYGKGVTQNYYSAVYWYECASAHNNASAQNSLGVCYEMGHGVEKNLAEAVGFYKRSAQQGNKYAQLNLGVCYEFGNGVEKNHTEAFKWYIASGEQGYAPAQFKAASCYFSGQGVEQNYTEAFLWYERAARQKHLDALEKLGDCYADGLGTEQNIEKAFEIYSEAQEKGSKTANRKINHLQSKHFCILCNEEQLEIYNKALENDAHSQFLMGKMLETGDNTPVNYKEAFKWYTLSAEQGNENAQIDLGRFYFNGYGTAKNYEKAVSLWLSASQKAELPEKVQNTLGWCYEHGEGVKKNIEKAVFYYARAAEKNIAYAQCALARCYYYGTGLCFSKLQCVNAANQWAELALKQGYKEAEQYITSPAEIEGLKLAEQARLDEEDRRYRSLTYQLEQYQRDLQAEQESQNAWSPVHIDPTGM